MKAVIVIPARYASTRLPGKPLLLIKNKPLIQWVWERAMKVKGASRVLVATDDERIARAVEYFGGESVMTSPKHPSGTDRMAEVARKVKADLYVNLQGDEPLVDPKEVDRLIAGIIAAPSAPIATLAHAFDGAADLANPNLVKVVTDRAGNALYFSRSPIPLWRDAGKKGAQASPKPAYLRHIGIYAYRAAALKKFVKLPPGALERAESLEQLRALENGLAIRVVSTKMRCHGVDTPADLAVVKKLL